MQCILKHFRNKRKEDSHSVGSQKRRDLGQSYVEHRLNLSELCEIYSDSYIDSVQPDQSDGLSCLEAQKRLQDGGLNLIQKEHEPNRINLLINQHFYQFWVLLVGASILSILTYVIRFYTHNDDTVINLTTAYILLPVVFLMVILSFWQERRTMHTVSIHETTLSKNSTVLRDCRAMIVPTDHLVVGDLVFIFSGQKVPADLRILQANALKIDSSAIIGKSDPIDYTSEASQTDVFSARNVAFQGTYCTEGDGLGLVIKTGRFTFLGNMFDVQVVDQTSLLRKDIKQTVDIITKVAIGMAFLFFLIGVIVSKFANVLYYFIVGFLIIIVANVPQGLAPAIMSYLAIIAKRLQAKSILIKNLDTIDELGATNVLLTSKAGILTQNFLTITDIWYNQKNLKVGRDPSKQHKRIQQHIEDSKARDALHQVIGICSRVWRHSTGNQSVRKARAASIAASIAARRESAFNMASPRKKLFTVVHESGYESIRMPGSFEKRPSILSENSLSKHSSLNELNSVELGEDQKSHQTTTSLTATTSAPNPQHQNSTDLAMQNYLISVNYPMEHLKRYYRPIFEVPYSPTRKWQLIICRCLAKINSPLYPNDELSEDQSVYVTMLKGAPEVILKQSTQFFTDKNGIQPIDEEFQKDCFYTWEKYSLNGKRTIAFALKYFIASKNQKFSANENEQNFPSTELIFLGFNALIDPPRPETVEAIQACKDAGIKIYMISGDHPWTSLAIACQIGLVEERIDKIPKPQSQLEFTKQYGKNWAVVHGKMLTTIAQDEWDEILAKHYIIFARTTPNEILQIVEACQARNEIVALFASSVSDAPALASANIGIASSQSSTDIAIKASDIVINEDSLSTIVKGIEAGRILFENLQLSIAYTLAHLWPEVLPIILNFTLGLPLGLDPMQILSIDLVCELPPAISLAYERPEIDIMKCPPRQKRQRLVTTQLLVYSYLFIGSLISIGCMATYFSVYYYNGVEFDQLFFNANDFWHGKAENLVIKDGKVVDSTEQMRIRGSAAAGYQICLVIAQVFHLFTCTTRRVSLFKHGLPSLPVFLAVLLELALLIIFMYTAWMQQLLGIQTPPHFVWLFGIATGLAILVFTEVRKFMLRNHSTNKCISLIEW